MITTGYVVEEVLRNLPDFPPLVSGEWVRLRSELLLMEDVITLDRSQATRQSGGFLKGKRIFQYFPYSPGGYRSLKSG